MFKNKYVNYKKLLDLQHCKYHTILMVSDEINAKEHVYKLGLYELSPNKIVLK
jgi:hypothetical protein